MIGIIANYGTKIVIATGPTREAAEEIALQLFAELGMDVKGIEIPMILFDPTETGGLILDPNDKVKDRDMGDWSPEGYMGPTGPP